MGGGREGHYGFHRRQYAVMILLFYFKGEVKSPILHNTRDGSMFLTFTLYVILGGGLGLWVGWEEGEEES